ncbi:MAG: RodZ domain-containing protein [Candidatus Omnitrophota bacterium]
MTQNNTTPKEIGKIFSESRRKLGLSVNEAYRRSNIHPKVIMDIETGVFERISGVYLKSFLKKYSAFLGLDTQGIMEKYESISAAIPVREFDLDIGEKEEKNDVLSGGDTETKKIRPATIAVYVTIFVVAVFVFSFVLKKERPSSEKKAVRPVVKNETVARPVALKTAGLYTPVSTVKEAKPVVLTLKAHGEAWVQLTGEGKTLFAGILKSGDSKTWKTNGVFTVWTGKAERLDFFVNTRKVGKVADGVVRDIKVSSSGIKVGNKWVASFE